MSKPIPHLPNEIITAIIEQIDDLQTTRSIATSCSRFQPLAETVLYRHIFHLTGSEAESLLRAIERRPERAKAIQTIDSRCKWHRRAGLIHLGPVLDRAKNARELTIQSPYCNSSYGREAEEWKQTMHRLLRPICRDDGLRHLTHLCLHLSGSPRYWIVDRELAPILGHPNLHSLTISCAELHEDALQGLKDCAQTPLRQLRLIECNITVRALQIVMSLPRALERLDLGENCYHQWLNTRQFRPDYETAVSQLCSTHVEAFFTALSRQKDSLKSLAYTVRGTSSARVTIPPTCQGLSEFTLLEDVTLDGYCAYFEKALSTNRTAPPHLASLTAKGDMFRLQCAPNLSLMDDYQSQVGWTIAAAGLSPHLRHVAIVSSRTFTNISKNHRDAVMELGKAFSAKKVGMKLWKRTFHRHIPPFLYGEQEYQEELVYDSETGFCKEMGSSGDRESDDINF